MDTALGWARIQFFRQMHVLVAAGIPLLRCLDICQRQCSHPKLRACLATASSEVRIGTRLSRALVQPGTVFNALQAQALQAAELRGALDQVFDELAHWDEKDHTLQRRLISSLSYPALVVAFSILGLMLLVRFLMPLIISVSQQLGKEPPAATKALVAVGRLIQNPLALAVGVLGLGLLYWGLRRVAWDKSSRLRLDRWRLHMPLLGPLMRTAAIIRVCRCMSALLHSGLNLVAVMELSGQSSGSPWMNQTIFVPATDNIRQGERLSQALRHAKLLPVSFHGMLAVGEQTGDIEMVLSKLADLYEMELDSQVESFVQALEPIVICGVGLLVLLLMLVGFMPLYEMLRGIA